MKRSPLLLTVLAAALISLAGCAGRTPPAARPLNADDGFAPSYVDGFTGVQFMLVPAGTFTMGSPDDEPDRDPDEGPAHPVTLDAFYIGKYEVTQGQWRQVMGGNPSRSKGHPDLPVDSVSWEAVQEFLKRLRKKTGVAYRLPTEAEWEYACRAGTRTPFFPGDDEQALNEYAWFTINSGGESHPVGRRRPNAWGLYDMHGNVSEWVGDGRRGYLSKAVKNPVGSAGQTYAMHRGGSWFYPARLCRSANRMTYEKNVGTHAVGFRLALDRAAVPAAP